MDSGSLEFRVATPSDAKRITKLIQSAFRAEDSRQGWTGSMELASRFQIEENDVLAKINGPDIVTLIALDSKNSALVATVDVQKCGAECGRLSMFAVDTQYQRGGVGGQVLVYAEDYCRRAWGARVVSLNALSTRKTLIEWYIRRGYIRTGETTPFPLEGYSNLELPEDICRVELEKPLQ